MSVRQVAAVIFDFDGVLADSEPLHLSAFRAALAERRLDLPEPDYYAHFLGYNDEDAFEAMGRRYGWSLSAADVTALVEAKMRHAASLLGRPDVLYADAAACVRDFGRAVPLAIASGAKRHEIVQVLDAHGLSDQFKVIVASGETPRSKPHPDPYARAVQLLQARGDLPGDRDVAGRCVALEDSRWGIASARAAGLRCVGITTSFPAEELREADLVVDRLAELSIERLATIVGAPG